MHQSALEFRPDIEGLRGIAVLLVLLAHAGVPGFSGGFVGVDIFFVISGYLITRMLRLELDRAGRLDFTAFYARRIRRLLPALLLMLAAVAVACQWLLPGKQQVQHANAGYWATLWASNVYFALAQIDYFGDDTVRNIFTHTWSLGVEEQFYLLWPLLLTLFWRRRRWFVWWVMGIGAASFLACIWVATRDANAAYYLMPTRLWQLAAGALVGMVGSRAGPWTALGLASCPLMLLSIDGQTPYPSPWALMPVLGAVLVLLGDPSKPGFAARLIANAPIRFIGRISYSLYLWHWPILVLTAMWWPRGGWWSITFGVVLSFVIGAISERWIERPFRRGNWKNQGVIVVGLFATLVLMSIMEFWQSRARLAHQALHLLTAKISLPTLYEVRGFDDYYSSSRFLPVVAVGGGAGSRHTRAACRGQHPDAVGAGRQRNRPGSGLAAGCRHEIGMPDARRFLRQQSYQAAFRGVRALARGLDRPCSGDETGAPDPWVCRQLSVRRRDVGERHARAAVSCTRGCRADRALCPDADVALQAS